MVTMPTNGITRNANVHVPIARQTAAYRTTSARLMSEQTRRNRDGYAIDGNGISPPRYGRTWPAGSMSDCGMRNLRRHGNPD
jgi:hypothetical protein